MPTPSLPLSSPLLNRPSRSDPAGWAMTLPEIAGMVMSFFPNAGLIARARGVSRTWWGIGTLVLRHFFRIDNDLALFFDDVVALRRFQCERDMLISGSFTLALFRWTSLDGIPTRAENADLDVYIEHSFKHDIDVLLEEEGYIKIGEFANFTATARDLGASIPDWSFECVVRYERGDRHIDVVCTRATPMYCIFSFHSSVVMNFIAWDRAVCMFPRETLLDHTGVVFRLNNDRTRRAIEKYESRGFKMQHWVEKDMGNKSYAKKARWACDDLCFTIPLRTEHIEFGVNPDTGDYEQMAVPSPYDWEVNGFLIDYWRAEGPMTSTATAETLWLPAMECEPLWHDGLMYSYACSSSFRYRVLRFIRNRILTLGNFWLTHIYVDDELLRLKDEQVVYDSA